VTLADDQRHSAPTASLYMTIEPGLSLPREIRPQTNSEEDAVTLGMIRQFEQTLSTDPTSHRPYKASCIDIAGLEVSACYTLDLLACDSWCQMALVRFIHPQQGPVFDTNASTTQATASRRRQRMSMAATVSA